MGMPCSWVVAWAPACGSTRWSAARRVMNAIRTNAAMRRSESGPGLKCVDLQIEWAMVLPPILCAQHSPLCGGSHAPSPMTHTRHGQRTQLSVSASGDDLRAAPENYETVGMFGLQPQRAQTGTERVARHLRRCNERLLPAFSQVRKAPAPTGIGEQAKSAPRPTGGLELGSASAAFHAGDREV